MKTAQLYLLLALTCLAESCNTPSPVKEEAEFNSVYKGERLNQVAFPMGGIGAGMICLE